MDKLALRNTENEALRETEIGFLAEAFREEPRTRRRLCSPPRPSVESLARGGDCVRTRDLLREARDEAESLTGSDVAGEGPTAYLLALYFDGT